MDAEEFVRQLQADPEYLARREAQEKRAAELERVCAEDQRLLVAEIRELGYGIASVWDLVNNDPHPFLERRFLGPYPRAYPVLIRHLELPHHPRVREGIIRALTVKDGGRAVEEALLEQFASEPDPGLRWVIASALRTVMPYHRRRKHPDLAQVFQAPQA